MAARISLPGHAPPPSTCCKAVARHSRGALPHKEACQLQNSSLRMAKHGLHIGRKAENRLFRGRTPIVVMSANRFSGVKWNSPSPSDTIIRFYTCINEKNVRELSEFLSEDCYMEECSFPHPFRGKKEVMNFLGQLTAAMGQNVKFSIGRVCEGDEYTAGVKWHLEWKKSQIPFTRGCSFFECSKEEEGMMIKKAQVVIESPIKPGAFVLILLKTVVSLFDDFPKVTEWFLSSPHVIFHWIVKIYTMLVAPFINPLITGYIQIWNYMTRILFFALNILRYIFKIFFK